MKKDMAKKFLKSHGKHDKYPRGSKVVSKTDEEGYPVNTGTSMKHVHRKEWNNRHTYGDYSVLENFLKSRIGCLWNDVYSEICEHADPRSYYGHHFRECLQYSVYQNCFYQNDVLHSENGNTLNRRHMDGKMYVDPDSGKLAMLKIKRDKKDKTKKVFEIDGNFYHKHKDIWYRVKMDKFPERTNLTDHIYISDAFIPWGYTDWRSKWTDCIKKYGKNPDGGVWYCARKQSANSKEISKIKKMLK